MRLDEIKGAVMASVIILSIGVIAVKAAPSSEKQKGNATYTTDNSGGTSAVIPTDTITVTPIETIKVTPTDTITVTKTELAKEDSTTGAEDTTSKVTPIVLSKTKYKEVTLISKADIKELTGFELTYKNITSIQKQLKKSSTWEAAGYSASDAKLIASRFTNRYNQTTGILKKLSKTNNLYLKVVVIDKPSYQNVNVGVSGYKADTES